MSAETVPASPTEICPACGHPKEAGEHRCEKCGRRLNASSRNSGEQFRGGGGAGNIRLLGPRRATGDAARGSTPAPVNPLAAVRQRGPAFPEPLRRQLSAQVREFRNRRVRPTLPFAAAEELPEAEKVVPIGGPEAPRVRKRAPSLSANRPLAGPAPSVVEKSKAEPRRSRIIAESQTPLEFPGQPPSPEFTTPAVAPFRTRVLGHCLDLAWILAALLVFAAPVKLLVGEVVYSRFLLAAGLAVGFGVALLYGVIFLYLAGATPAMKHLGLQLVNFDGLPASRPERLWRFLGAVASAGSFLLGFVWAAVDEERFSWHDRISRTFLTYKNR